MTKTRVTSITAFLLLLLLLPAAVGAQSNRAWSEPYQRGQDAIKAKKYDEAVTELEAAIKANPKAEGNKRLEGVFSIDYFPYYYLGVAYFELGNFRRAQENFEKAESPAPRDKALVAKLKEYRLKAQAALQAPASRTEVARVEPLPATSVVPAAPEVRAAAPAAAPASAAAPAAGADEKRKPDVRPPSAPDPLKTALRTALRALFGGDAQAAIATLEPLAGDKTGSPADLATLHAYLGVAYETRALAASTRDEGARLEAAAGEQFKRALAAQSSYQLSGRMVSPKIVAMFNQARR